MKNEKLKAWLFLIGLAIMVSYTFLKHPIQDSLLLKNGKTIRAVIINERGYNGKGGFISKEENGDPIVYKYRFTINGKEYTGDSQSTKFSIGDSIDVLYLESFPSVNRPTYYLQDDK
ncbi:hypothetical protein FLA105534_01330 [Flavobacterium bizetiae]|uniref:DUF3592 domain-containing protein n=1 Tax=Flavobacterium bizetiae TaxID=2704140 RepID=A0A6J4GEU1_9FLAO|nr:hypothetical protein [Flavobacterium bizetiae]CAA9196815.1 hypothetical protein FLA105534_01330 [Flavobacterium bizetiae]CAD5340216.1 hypothetical protein FLA105535_00170 [Flavobacterium bizetiae]CAD5346800.1 hypothetical protein FLA105534_00743 [Flavobacterium bizetiae]